MSESAPAALPEVEIPAWVLPEDRRAYAFIARKTDEHEAARFARVSKQKRMTLTIDDAAASMRSRLNP